MAENKSGQIKPRVERGGASDWSEPQIEERATVTDEILERAADYARSRNPALADLLESEVV